MLLYLGKLKHQPESHSLKQQMVFQVCFRQGAEWVLGYLRLI